MNAFWDIKIVKEMRTIFCLIFLLLCAGTASASESNGATVKVFSASEMEGWYYYSKYWDISPEDMFEIGSKLYPYLKEKLPEDVDLSEYKQQYYGFYDKNGEKKNFINFFCVARGKEPEEDEELKKRNEISKKINDVNVLRHISGGGDCHFNFIYDRKKKKFYDMHINAPY